MLGWFQNWRERRAALNELRDSQRAEEALLLDQTLNPLNMAKLSLGSGNHETLASYWDSARQLLPNAIMTSPDSLEILLALKRHDEAEELMRRCRKRFPRDPAYLIGLAQIAEARGDLNEATKQWKNARNRSKNLVGGFLGYARCLMALGRLDEAEVQWTQAIRRDPNNLQAWAGRARVCDLRKDWEQSIERWKYMAETYREPPAFACVAKAMVELGRVDEAEAWLAEPSRLYTNDLEIAVAHAELAQRRGDVSAACDRWARVRAINPAFHAGYHDGSFRLIEAARHAEAEAVLREAMERFPDEVWPYQNFAQIAHNQSDWNEAASRWATLRQRFPSVEAGLSFGAEALEGAGRHAEAAALRRTA